MRLPSGELATTDKENVKLFSIYFGKVLNYINPTNDSIINGIQLRDALTDLYIPPEWAEFTIAVTELTDYKSPRLNNIPPNDFKAVTPENLLRLLDLIIKF